MQRHKRLGLMINATDSDYAKGIIEGVSAWCREQGLELVIFSGRSFGWPYGWEYQCTAIYGHIHRGTIDALVIASGTQCNFMGEAAFADWVLKLAPLPVVSIAIPIEGVPSILVDNRSGLRKLLDHLFDKHGCRRFGVIAGPYENSEARERMDVFARFLADHDLAPEDQTIFTGDFSAESVFDTLTPWLAKNRADFTALVCMNDTMASAALQVLAETGYRVPEDIIVSGFDDILKSRFESPTLTTVTQDLEGQGRLAAAMAQRLVEGESVEAVTSLNTRPLFRQSCGCIGHEELAAKHVALDEDHTCIDLDAQMVMQASNSWFRMQDDLLHLREYLSNMISLVSMGDLVDRLPRGLGLFGIKAAALVLFDEAISFPRGTAFRLPARAKRILHFDRGDAKGGAKVSSGSSSGSACPAGGAVAFNPRLRLVPENTFGKRARRLVAASLYHRDAQLGYLVWEPGNCDPSIYETICVQLASTIRSAMLFEAKQEAETRLNMALKDLERYNSTLSAISRTDELTGLFNRRGFVTLGQESMDLAVRMDKHGLVVFSDMDGLKLINDTWGHEAGDRAIVAMGQALRRTFRSMDIVARLGGDEFAVVALDINKSFVDTLRARLDSILDEFNRTSGEPYTLSLSMGAVEFSGTQNQELEGLLSTADSLLYEEKKRKRAQRAAL